MAFPTPQPPPLDHPLRDEKGELTSIWEEWLNNVYLYEKRVENLQRDSLVKNPGKTDDVLYGQTSLSGVEKRVTELEKQLMAQMQRPVQREEPGLIQIAQGGKDIQDLATLALLSKTGFNGGDYLFLPGRAGGQFSRGNVFFDTPGLSELSADPGNPGVGRTVIWQSDGYGATDDGDIILRSQYGGTTRTMSLMQWPVGSIFLTVANNDPYYLLGYGGWSRVGEGLFLVGYKASDPDFDPVENTGGSKNHVHQVDVGNTTSDGPSAVETVDNDGSGSTVDVASDAHTHDVDPDPVNSGNPSELPPFYVVHMWKRIT